MVPGPHFAKLCSKIEEYFPKLAMHALLVKLSVKVPRDQVLSVLRDLIFFPPGSLRRGWFKEIGMDLRALCSEVRLGHDGGKRRGCSRCSSFHKTVCATGTNDIIKAGVCCVLVHGYKLFMSFDANLLPIT